MLSRFVPYKANISVFVPLILAVVIGGAILALVVQLVQFSEEVTDYYTPSLLASEN